MNVRRRLSFFFPLLLAVACSDLLPNEPDNRTPDWLDAYIAQIESEPVSNPPSAIYSYRYHGETVYYRTSRLFDIQSEVYDEEGRLLCRPDGGAGGGDGRCPDFLETRTEERLVWRDPRS
jgi:hypothetical protein